MRILVAMLVVGALVLGAFVFLWPAEPQRIVRVTPSVQPTGAGSETPDDLELPDEPAAGETSTDEAPSSTPTGAATAPTPDAPAPTAGLAVRSDLPVELPPTLEEALAVVLEELELDPALLPELAAVVEAHRLTATGDVAADQARLVEALVPLCGEDLALEVQQRLGELDLE